MVVWVVHTMRLAVRNVSLDLTASNRRYDYPAAFQLETFSDCKYSPLHQCIAQPNTTFA